MHKWTTLLRPRVPSSVCVHVCVHVHEAESGCVCVSKFYACMYVCVTYLERKSQSTQTVLHLLEVPILLCVARGKHQVLDEFVCVYVCAGVSARWVSIWHTYPIPCNKTFHHSTGAFFCTQTRWLSRWWTSQFFPMSAVKKNIRIDQA